MEPKKSNQEKLIKEAEAAAEQASETTEQVEEQHAEHSAAAQPTQPTQPAQSEPAEPLVVPDSVVVPQKKKHTARNIILIILGLLVLGCAGVAIWFFAYYNNPEKVATDAMQNFFSAENVALNATYQQTGDNALTARVAASANRHLPASFSLQLEQASSTRLDARLDIDKDGVIYASVDGLPELLGVTKETRTQVAALGEDFQTILGLVDEVNAETWRIDIPEIIAELNLDKELGAAYTCIVNQVQHSDTTSAVAQAYTQSPFLKVKTASDNSLFHNSYDLTLDSAQLTHFLNDISGEPAAQTRHCFDNIQGVTVTAGKVSESEVEAFVGELPTINIKVDWLSHRLTSVSAQNDEMKFTADVNYPAQVTVNTPDEYRSATEILDQFTDVIMIYANNQAFAATEL